MDKMLGGDIIYHESVKIRKHEKGYINFVLYCFRVFVVVCNNFFKSTVSCRRDP